MEILKAPSGIAMSEYLEYANSGAVELIDGVMVRRPARTAEQTETVGALYRALSAWDFRRKYLSVYSSTAVAKVKPEDRSWIEMALVPDVIGYSTTRLQEYKILNPDYRSRPLTISPRLAADVLAADITDADTRRAALYLEYGAETVWLLIPSLQTASIYRADGSKERVLGDGKLSGEEMLPGFEISLAALFTQRTM